VPQLPHWTDAQSVTSYITSLIAFALSVVTTFHPGFNEPAVVQSVIPAVGLFVAGLAQAVNVFTHRAAHALASKVPVKGDKGDKGDPGEPGTPGTGPEVDIAAVANRAADILGRRIASGTVAAPSAAQ
jgi:hypothetical protein